MTNAREGLFHAPSRIPSWDDLYGDSFREYMTANAPACPSCGELALVATRMPEVDKFGQIQSNGDRVIAALEVYRCSSCGSRASQKVELDRITSEEQDRETDRAVARAQLRRELRDQAGILGIFRRVERGIEAEVQRQHPKRPDPDLMQRWQERRMSE